MTHEGRALDSTDIFADRHIGPRRADIDRMLSTLGVESLDALIAQAVPDAIRTQTPLNIGRGLSESQMLTKARGLASKNRLMRSFIGMGYSGCVTPPVIQRNILEDPGWYTQYTPYQPEISQGRLEALLNYQTMVSDLTGLPLSNASLLDEATAAAEAMAMCHASVSRKTGHVFLADARCHPQTLDVIQTRAQPLGIEVRIEDVATAALPEGLFGVLIQYPDTEGRVVDFEALSAQVHDKGAMVIVATDLMALTLLRPPGEFGADVAVGSSQRFGVPMGYGGPHAAFFATTEAHQRRIPGRIVGVTRDADGKQALRLALQTREQHIRRERATSNICTSQVLLAIVASMYAVYHGPAGLRAIAERIALLTDTLAAGLRKAGFDLGDGIFFDTLVVPVDDEAALLDAARAEGINLRGFGDGRVGVSLDETATAADIEALWSLFGAERPEGGPEAVASAVERGFEAPFARQSAVLEHPIFNTHHSETMLLRYMTGLKSKDLSLTTSMIPLGSCTMKLNATAEMMPITLPGFGSLHPFVPADQAQGYGILFDELERDLADITGFFGVSLQPNAGSQGEYAGLLVIRAWHHSRGDHNRNVCLIPTSAHGTNPASAVMAGFKVVAVKCDDEGNIDIPDLSAKAEKHKDRLGALMVTYPSTHGVFEEGIRQICTVVHDFGGQVYLDGANLNAMVGLCRIGEIGADVCHLNLHKTFCLSEGTPVALGNGVQRPIEQLMEGEKVLAWSADEGGVRSERLLATFDTGKKDCVQITLEDGRSIVCTPDHRILTSLGWVRADQLDLTQHRLVVGTETPLDDLNADRVAERRFQAVFGGLSLRMDEPTARAKVLAFFRLLGMTLSDGTYSEEKSTGRRQIRLYFGATHDAHKALDDIELLSGKRPKISSSGNVFSVRMPVELLKALESVPGMGQPGKRTYSKVGLPDIINAPQTPLAVVREFLGGLFGGDGCSPMVVHLQNNPNTLKEVRFVQTRDDRAAVVRFMAQIRDALERLGVESYLGEPFEPVATHPSKDGRERWRCELKVVWGTAFAENVGFRYCAHKSARLTAATAWWRLKETVKRQQCDVARRALEIGSTSKAKGPIPVWQPAVERAFEEVVGAGPVLNAYYAGFKGYAKVSRQHLNNAIEGQIGKRKDIQGVRRTHRRATFPAMGRGGAPTGMPSLDVFLERIGAASWFNKHTPRGESYSVTYATGQDHGTEPVLNLGIVDIRPVGERTVYDLTVDKLHSFMAQGVVVHNCIPHGGGGPGMGPIGVAKHLVPFLPNHAMADVGGEMGIGAVAAAPWGSPSILPISWAYIQMMGGAGLTEATRAAILNANYIASRLEAHFPVLYKGAKGRVAHECIVDMRHFRKSAGITVADVAKRLMDFGFHAPTMSWPVAGTMMIEPTESESLEELDRFCEAMITIRQEIRDIEEGRADAEDNPLRRAPHTAEAVCADVWERGYSRQQAAFPARWVRSAKFWPAVGRVDDAFGDRNLVCACPPVEEFDQGDDLIS